MCFSKSEREKKNDSFANKQLRFIPHLFQCGYHTKYYMEPECGDIST